MTFRPIGSSHSSIASSFTNHEVHSGVREIPFDHFSDPKKHFYDPKDDKWAHHLADQISTSKEIEPLIVAYDHEGPYILEGQHRFVALHHLGHKTFPAIVVHDQDEVKTNGST